MGKRETRPGSFSASADSGLKFPKVSRHGQGKPDSGPNSGRRASSLSSRDERRKLDSKRQADSNIASVCVACHTAIHTSGALKVSGDADLTDQDGVFCGLEIYRKDSDEWRLVEKR